MGKAKTETIAALNATGMKGRDRTNAARQKRWRERRRLQTSGSAAQTVTIPAAITSPPSVRRRSVVPALTLCAALAVAAVSGSFSIIGLAAVFTGAFWPVIAMGGALECAKLASVAWLGRRYSAPRTLKVAVTDLVITLSGLSSIGSFGFLSKAHLAHVTASEAQITEHQARIDARKEVAAANVADIDKRIGQVDASVNETIKRGRTDAAMKLAEHQDNRRNALVAERAEAAKSLSAIEVEGAAVANERNELKADTGPIRYLAALTGTDDEKLMRWFVLAVSGLLDPLAVVMLLVTNSGR
jgi:hypothetical protein